MNHVLVILRQTLSGMGSRKQWLFRQKQALDPHEALKIYRTDWR